MFTRAVLAIFVTTIITVNHVLVTNGWNLRKQSQDSEEEEDTRNDTLDDMHTFVALIDIVFVDRSKRTCTGSIIHDNVVITAAHCFHLEDKPTIQPELTASLVVIGTRKMFDSGYEQYLPIEKVIRHPNFKGWTADLALVYTFSGMTSDKPGTIIPLDGEKSSTPVDSNVTVLSWGVCPDHYDEYDEVTTRKSATKAEEINEKDDCDSDETITPKKEYQGLESDEPHYTKRLPSRFHVMYTQGIPNYRNVKNRQQHILSKLIQAKTISRTTRYQSIYLSSRESKEMETYNNNRKYKPRRIQKKNSIKSLYTGWRRTMGSQKNKLSVEVFGFVNMQACKKIVEKSMAQLYMIGDSSEVVCYASEDHYITAEDSGAPAVRKGRLIAVTVGGAECDGDHVAIGMKMNCFCSWIAENLPEDSQPKMKCCKNCCNGSNQQQNSESKKNSKSNRQY